MRNLLTRLSDFANDPMFPDAGSPRAWLLAFVALLQGDPA